MDAWPDPEAPPTLPPPSRRVLDAVALEGLEGHLGENPERRAEVKSRDFPELHGLEVQAEDVEVVLFDKYSVDSFAACFAARSALGSRAKYVAVDRSTTVEEVNDFISFEGKVVAMLGICLAYEEMHGLFYEGSSWMIVLENHPIAAQELALLSYPNLVTIVDPNMGAGALAWNFFLPGQPVPHLIRYIEDMDLGREVLRDATAFADGFEVAFENSCKAPMGEVPRSDEAFFDFEVLLEEKQSTIEQAIEKGLELAPDIREQGLKAFADCEVKIFNAFPAWRCAVVGLSSPSAGRVAEVLVEEMVRSSAPEEGHRCMAAVFEARGTHVRAVLRSLEGGPRVDEIGSLNGGCGHPQQAFFSVPLDVWEELWAPAELVLWDVPSAGPSCLSLSRGDLVTVARKGERFREAPFEEWSWASRTSGSGGAGDEGWVPTLAHTLFLATQSVPSEQQGVDSLEEGDLLVVWAQRGQYMWGARCGGSIVAAFDGPKSWFPDVGLQAVHARSVRELLSAACGSCARGGA